MKRRKQNSFCAFAGRLRVAASVQATSIQLLTPRILGSQCALLSILDIKASGICGKQGLPSLREISRFLLQKALLGRALPGNKSG